MQFCCANRRNLPDSYRSRRAARRGGSRVAGQPHNGFPRLEGAKARYRAERESGFSAEGRGQKVSRRRAPRRRSEVGAPRRGSGAESIHETGKLAPRIGGRIIPRTEGRKLRVANQSHLLADPMTVPGIPATQKPQAQPYCTARRRGHTHHPAHA